MGELNGGRARSDARVAFGFESALTSPAHGGRERRSMRRSQICCAFALELDRQRGERLAVSDSSSERARGARLLVEARRTATRGSRKDPRRRWMRHRCGSSSNRSRL